MSLEHCRVYYGKYLDDITTLIDPTHYILEEFSDIGHELEPGEPNVPTSDEISITLRNRDEEGTLIYPFSFWQGVARSEAEGGTLPIEIFFKVEILGEVAFIGVYNAIDYGIRDEKCTITIRDITDVLKQDNRRMLRSFELPELQVLALDSANTGYNQFGTLRDHAETIIPHEAITIRLLSKILDLNVFGVPTYQGGIKFEDAFIKHLGIIDSFAFDIETYDVTRNMFIQIGDNTVFTKVRIWGAIETQGLISYKRLYMTIYHHRSDFIGDVIPRGRFYKSDRTFEPIEEDDRIKVTIHDYLVPPASSSVDQSELEDIMINDGDLPAYRDYIFGCSYVEDGGQLQLTTERYTYFNVVERTFDIFRNYVGRRFTSSGMQGQIEVLEDAPASASPSKASFTITVGAPAEGDHIFNMVVDNDYYQSAIREVEDGDSVEEVVDIIEESIGASDSKSKLNWTANATATNVVTVTSIENTDRFNGWQPYTLPNNVRHDLSLTISAVSGGAKASLSGGLRVVIQETEQTPEIDVTTASITGSEAKADIAQKILDALEADGDFNSHFTGSRTDAIVNVVLTTGTQPAFIQVFEQDTQVEVRARNVVSSYELFDTTKMIERNQHAFFADPIMFGWVDKKLPEILVGVAWQITAYLYTTSEGKIAIQSRDWYEQFSDLYTGGAYPLTTMQDQFLKPTSGVQRDNGFQSYSVEHPIDVIEVNNVESRNKQTIFAGGLGEEVVNQVFNRAGDTQEVRIAGHRPSAKNKELKTSNYRIFDLGIPSQYEFDRADFPILRLSPADPAWQFEEDLNDFVPTPSLQAYRMLDSFEWPVESILAEFHRNRYPDVQAGDYVVLENLNLYLVKSLSVTPSSLIASIELEYKKTLVTESITWDTDEHTFDTTLISFDQT